MEIKRITDLAVSVLLLALALPVIAVLAVASAVSLRAWPFFVQERVGRDGEVFRFVKIRTLPASFAAYAAKPALQMVRIPLAMRLLRISHLDELPQLALVVVGKMSLVGPRPEMPMLHDQLAPAVAAERLSVRPGVTGLWQVSAHCDGLIHERIEYDRLYVRYRGPLLDLWVLWKTIEKVALGRRVHLFEVPRWAIGSERAVLAPRLIDLTPVAVPMHLPSIGSTADEFELVGATD